MLAKELNINKINKSCSHIKISLAKLINFFSKMATKVNGRASPRYFLLYFVFVIEILRLIIVYTTVS